MSGIGRRSLLKTPSVAAGGLALGGQVMATTAAAAPTHSARASGGSVMVRWIGGGVVEVATPDNKQLAYVDAWV